MFVYYVNTKTMNKDIQFCRGAGCLLRDTCKRAKDDKEDGEIWFADEPFRIIDGKFNCDLYWGKSQMDIFEQLKDNNGQAETNRQTDGGESGT